MRIDAKFLGVVVALIGMMGSGLMAYGALSEKVANIEKEQGRTEARFEKIDAKLDRIYDLLMGMTR